MLQKIRVILFGLLTMCLFNYATCSYSFNDSSPIPTDITTFRVNYLENKAQYVNAQLSPQLTEKLKQKIINTTRLRQTNSEDADYDISGYVSQYYTSTISISGNNSSGNRLTLGFHLTFRNKKDEKKNIETDLVRTYDYNANLSLSQAEVGLTDEMVKNLSDEIFNKIFSNW
jgi:hypothetical protein